MLSEKGIIISLQGDIAIVHTQNQLACASCKVVDTCGNGIVEKFLSGKIFVSEMRNEIAAKVGDQVIIEIPKSSITKAAIVVYFVPLAFLLVFAICAQLLAFDENMVILISILGLIFGLLVTKYYNRKVLKIESYLPKMVSIIDTKHQNDRDTNSGDKNSRNQDLASQHSLPIKILPPK